MLLRSPLALNHNYSITGVALFSALRFPPATAEQEDVATSVALRFCASSIYGCPEAAQHGRIIQTFHSSSRCHLLSKWKLWNGCMWVKAQFKMPHMRQRCWIEGSMKGGTLFSPQGPVPQDTDCSGANDFGYFLSRDPQVPCNSTLQTQPVMLPVTSPSRELPVTPWAPQPWQHSPPLKSIKLQAFVTSRRTGTVT